MRALLSYLFAFLILFARAQNEALSKNAFLQQDVQTAFEFWNTTHPSTEFHSSFRPYLSSTFTKAQDSLVPFTSYGFQNSFLSYSLNRSALSKTRHQLQVLPILDLEMGYDALLKNAIPTLAGGLHSKYTINDNFTFALTVIAGNTKYPFYLDTSISKQNLIPEFGQAYPSKVSSYNFADVQGYLSYTPKGAKMINLQLGRDKHFIGDGYRSMLYSDFGPAIPYLGINANFWRFQYNVWYNWMVDVNSANGVKNNFKNKFGTFHYLSFNILKELQIGFFENVVWKGTDTNGVRNFEVHYINPVILLRPQEYAVGSPDNSFIGLNLNFTLWKTLKCYGQIGLDEFYFKEVKAGNGWWANKQAWQAGFNYVNAFGIKGLKLRVEHNQARPYTYTHGIVEQNYANYGQALAHPMGANFKETLLQLALRKKNWQVSAQGMLVLIGKDSLAANSNVGQNIFLSYNTRPFDYGHSTTQGVLTQILQSELKFSWFLVPKLNLRVELCYIQRAEETSQNYKLQNPYFSFGIKTSIWNSYKDF